MTPKIADPPAVTQNRLRIRDLLNFHSSPKMDSLMQWLGIGRLIGIWSLLGLMVILPWNCPAAAADTATVPDNSLFRRDNLVAWCIVPFDSQRRGPEARAAMLKKLGIQRLAYDYRAEHIPTFEAELDALKTHGIELTAWWFPGTLNDEARQILALLERRQIQTQLWITGGGTATTSPAEQAARVQAEADRIRPLAEAAAKIGCTIGLYNHGGWFGEPENQLAIIEALKLPNVGIVYNLHHGHDQIDRLPALLQKMQPHLLVFNLNGMVTHGDRSGQKIRPIGTGDQDEFWLKTLRTCGYSGPVGILNHTNEDAELRLQDNLDGLAWLIQRADGKAASEPRWRSWQRPAVSSSPTPETAGKLLPGKAEYRQPPLTVECRATLNDAHGYNILVASDTKASGSHWELFTQPGSGQLSAYLPGYRPDHVHTAVAICDGKPHTIVMQFEPGRVRLYVDGKSAADTAVAHTGRAEQPGGLGIGRLVEGNLSSRGNIAWVRLSRGVRELPEAPPTNVERNEHTIDLWTFADATTATSQQPPAAPVYDPALVQQLTESAGKSGDAGRGLLTFTSAKFACLSCHKIGEQGGAVGPELTQIGKQRTPAQLAESLLWPKRDVKPEYISWTAVDINGRVFKGYKIRENDDSLTLRDPALGTEQTLAKDDIDDLIEAGTLMPDGLVAGMTAEQQQDLVKFLSGLGTEAGISPESIRLAIKQSQVHGPVGFDFIRDPLHPADWPSWQAYVNRDRIYDFYAKQADHFRQEHHPPHLMTEYPGLDGGTLGHWGNQNEQSWASSRWNETQLGTVQAGIFRGDGVTVPRGVCVRLGDHGELSACFNPDTLTYDAVWKDGFVSFSSVRHGFMHGLQMQGTALPKPDSTQPGGTKDGQPSRYLGFYRHGPRVAFAYRLGNVDYLDVPWVRDGQFMHTVAPADEHPQKELMLGGAAQWPEPIRVEGEPGNGSPYAVDTIPLPVENPWKALIFCGGHDFLPDGSAMVCTMQGDVWQVTGLDDTLKQVQWRRFASGLHHALGLVVADGSVYVQGRDQITKLQDRNGDGEADFYECFSKAFETSPAGHDFICGLERDANGVFYTASGNQGLLAISPDGQQCQVLATGFRNPDGLGLTPDGLLTVPVSEGDWTPATMIHAVRPGVVNTHIPGLKPIGGFIPPYFGYGGPRDGRAPDLPLVYIPRGLDNSAGGQTYINSDRWGPLQGRMLHFSFGTGSHFLLLRDEVGGQLQGGLVPLPGEFRSGAHRGRFNPADGQLYVSGMTGWGCYTPDDGCFQRVRYTGAPVLLPTGFHVHENGIVVRFSGALDPDSVENPGQHFAQCWNYRYSSGYGSAEFSSRHFGARGHDRLTIASAHIVESGDSLFLELPELQPVNQLHLRLQPRPGVFCDLFLTVHRLDEYFQCHQPRQTTAKVIAPHPILADLALATSRVPNPWLKRNHKARPVVIEAGKNLTFATRSFEVKPGEAIRLTFKNPDVVPHNWALLKPGTLQKVGELTNRLIADPDAVARHYIPQTDDVLAYTDVVLPQDEFTIWITAPKAPGRYPYLCTFPGHWMVMNGELIVTE